MQYGNRSCADAMVLSLVLRYFPDNQEEIFFILAISQWRVLLTNRNDKISFDILLFQLAAVL